VEKSTVLVDTIAAPFEERAAVPIPMHAVTASSLSAERALLLALAGVGLLELCHD
jgi:hypothetical protein